MELGKTDDVVRLLPEQIRLSFSSCDRSFFNTIREIHLRVGAPVMVTVSAGNYFISTNGKPSNLPIGANVSRELLCECVRRLCGGSVYSYEDTVRRGYIPHEGGVRIGVCGTVFTSRDGKESVGNISSLTIRIPHNVKDVSGDITELFKKGEGCGVLVYSPPGGGKTTILRDLAVKLSSGISMPPLKVAIADERCEFTHSSTYLCDVYVGYKKADAIELATRTMAPDVIICDEIGTYGEAEAILNVQSTGVPLVASAHAKNKKELYARPAIRLLLEAGVFGYIYSVLDKRLERIL
jgi:stage III sporulation protein AA